MDTTESKKRLKEWGEPTPRNRNPKPKEKRKVGRPKKEKPLSDFGIIVDTPITEVKKNKEWDICIGDEIKYFDPTLSYELTGYRPITKTQALDFNPKLFSEDAAIYLKTGVYTDYPKGTKPYMDFWRERMRRCSEGYTVGKYTLTGDNYFFLNFYRLPNVSKYEEDGSPESFPNFYVKQYEFFHYVKLCEKLGKDVNSLKSRGIGWSEIAACLAVCPYTVLSKYRVVCSAFSEGHLSPLLQKCWTQLHFLNQHTQGGFRRIRQVKDSETWKRASKKDRDGNELGHKSEIQGIIAELARKLRGDRTRRLLFEESGSDPILITKYNQSEALVKVLGKRMGTRFTWGTGGDNGPALVGLATIFMNPEDFDVLPYKNNYNDKGETVYTGFFIPAYALLDQFTDERGVTDEEQAREFYENERKKKSNNAQNLIEYKSEYCFTPEEALIRQGDDEFDTVKLTEQLANIDLHKTVELPKNGKLLWSMGEDGKADVNSKPYWELSNAGKIRILEHPLKNQEGETYKNLYVGGIDSIDSDKDTSTGQKQVSDFCIVIKRRQFGMNAPKIVAIYKDRPNDVREAYNNALKLLQYYDCQAVLESTRTGIVSHYKTLNKLGYLMKRPRMTQSDVMKGKSNMYGTPATEHVINHYKELINNYINDYYLNINFREVVEQALHYSDEFKKKFDIIAAWGIN